MPTFEVVQDPEVVRLVHFSNGMLTPEARKNLEFKCYSDKSNKRKLAVTTKTNGIEYSGQNFGQSNTFSQDGCDYYVAVARKGADKIQILSAELFTMHPKMEEEKDQSSSDGEVKGREAERKEYAEKTHSLTAQFGSGKSQRMMKKALDQRMEDKAIGLMSQSVPVTAGANRESSTVESSVIPPHNKDAQKPEDVYLLETIIPDWVMDQLTEQSQVFVNCTTYEIENWRNYKTYPSLVLDLLGGLPLSSDERQWKCSLIMYLHCLMFTYNLKANKLAGSFHFPGEWKGLVKKLLDDSFTLQVKNAAGRTRRTRPTHIKDLLLSHILILNLRLHDYAYPLKPLINDLKLNAKRTALHARTLGLTVTGKVDQEVRLKIPFKLPTTNNKFKSKS